MKKDDTIFFEEQLCEAKNALFAAKTVKQIKFLQNKINYLNEQMKRMKRGRY